MSGKRNVVVVGNGMVGHQFVERLLAGGAADAWNVTVAAEEPRAAYDRVNLSKFFEGADAAALALASPERYADAGVRLLLGDPVESVDLQGHVASTRGGAALPYDKLVLATGSVPFV